MAERSSSPSAERHVLARLGCAMRARGRANLPGLFLMTDAKRLPDPLPAIRALPPGAGVILRHYEWPQAQREKLARDTAALCAARHLSLFIAADPHLAARVGARGCHVPEASIGKLRAWRRLFPHLEWTAAVHGAKGLLRARMMGAKAVILSPVFATPSHPVATGLGLLRFEALASAAPMAVIALGGVTERTAARLRASRATGLAAISGLSAGG